MKMFDPYEGKPFPTGIIQRASEPWIIFPEPTIMYTTASRKIVMKAKSTYVVLGKENEMITILSEKGIIGWISIEALTEDDEVK
jgi:hypothetical protein